MRMLEAMRRLRMPIPTHSLLYGCHPGADVNALRYYVPNGVTGNKNYSHITGISLIPHDKYTGKKDPAFYKVEDKLNFTPLNMDGNKYEYKKG